MSADVARRRRVDVGGRALCHRRMSAAAILHIQRPLDGAGVESRPAQLDLVQPRRQSRNVPECVRSRSRSLTAADCAPVRIVNPSRVTLVAPRAFRANTFGGDCTTVEGQTVVFPSPGSSVEYGGPFANSRPSASTVLKPCAYDQNVMLSITGDGAASPTSPATTASPSTTDKSSSTTKATTTVATPTSSAPVVSSTPTVPSGTCTPGTFACASASTMQICAAGGSWSTFRASASVAATR